MAIDINLARFTINGTPSEAADGDRGFDATPGQVLTIALERNPAAGALLVKFSLPLSSAVPVDSDSTLSSLFDTPQVFSENGQPTILLAAEGLGNNDPVHVTVNPVTEISSYVIRCEVVTARGQQSFERLLVVRENGLRMTTPTERQEYGQRGWSDAMNELTKALVSGSGSVALVTGGTQGSVSPFGVGGVDKLLVSDGATPGGKWVGGPEDGLVGWKDGLVTSFGGPSNGLWVFRDGEITVQSGPANSAVYVNEIGQVANAAATTPGTFLGYGGALGNSIGWQYALPQGGAGLVQVLYWDSRSSAWLICDPVPSDYEYYQYYLTHTADGHTAVWGRIEAGGLPEGTATGQLLRWDGESWAAWSGTDAGQIALWSGTGETDGWTSVSPEDANLAPLDDFNRWTLGRWIGDRTTIPVGTPTALFLNEGVASILVAHIIHHDQPPDSLGGNRWIIYCGVQVTHWNAAMTEVRVDDITFTLSATLSTVTLVGPSESIISTGPPASITVPGSCTGIEYVITAGDVATGSLTIVMPDGDSTYYARARFYSRVTERVYIT